MTTIFFERPFMTIDRDGDPSVVHAWIPDRVPASPDVPTAGTPAGASPAMIISAPDHAGPARSAAPVPFWRRGPSTLEFVAVAASSAGGTMAALVLVGVLG